MSYEAIVGRVKTSPHPNADRLQLGHVNGYTVIIGIDVPDGTLGVFFPPDGQLSEAFCEANDLIGYTDPDTGEKKGGYFAKNRRVRAQKLRGVKSEGYWTTFDSFAFTGYDMNQLREGDKFADINGVPICNKYYTPATLRQMKSGGKIQRKNKCFPKHFETAKLQYEVASIERGSIMSLTEKVHGTSGRYAFVIDEKEKPRRWYHKLFRLTPKTESSYEFMIGTRNVILGKHEGPSYYGKEEFRYSVGTKMEGALQKGEIIYGEIVGFTENGPIMPEHDNTKLKEVKKAYGPKMLYKYGNIPGGCEFYVYRIAHVNEDGQFIDLSWHQVKARCEQLGLKVVPELHEPFIYNGNPDYLIELADQYMEGPSTLDDSHIREGVVFRVESPSGKTEFYKSKSWTFGVLEGYIKDNEDYVDPEEVA